MKRDSTSISSRRTENCSFVYVDNKQDSHAFQYVQKLLAETLRVVHQRDRGEARLARQLVRATQLAATFRYLALRVALASTGFVGMTRWEGERDGTRAGRFPPL